MAEQVSLVDEAKVLGALCEAINVEYDARPVFYQGRLTEKVSAKLGAQWPEIHGDVKRALNQLPRHSFVMTAEFLLYSRISGKSSEETLSFIYDDNIVPLNPLTTLHAAVETLEEIGYSFDTEDPDSHLACGLVAGLLGEASSSQPLLLVEMLDMIHPSRYGLGQTRETCFGNRIRDRVFGSFNARNLWGGLWCGTTASTCRVC